MNIDLDKIVGQIRKWDLSFTLGGRTYKVRPLSGADFAAIVAADAPAERKLIEDAFEQPGVPAELLDNPETFQTLCAGIVGYFRGMQRKNFQAVVAAVAATVMDSRVETAGRRAENSGQPGA